MCDRGRARAQPVIENRAEIDPVVERAAVPRTFDEMGRVARPEQRVVVDAEGNLVTSVRRPFSLRP